MIKKTTDLTIFGKTIPVKNYICSKNGCPYTLKKPPVRIQLSVCPTYMCGANCRFCSASGSRREGYLDLKALERTLVEMKRTDSLRGIGITGGEPFTDVGLLNEIVQMIFDVLGLEVQLSINTNGTGLKDIHRIKRLEFVDTIHISRHHYEDARNDAYFGVKTADTRLIKETVESVYDPKLFVFNCLLLADGIGTKEEMVRFLDFTAHTGVPKAAFVTPMVVNEYTKKNRVSYRELFDRGDDRFLFTKEFADFDNCRCTDGVYVSPEGKLVEFYGRETVYGCCDYVRGLVLGADGVLRTGFSEDAQVIADCNG
ncbi:MAG: radical SAM protein [Lachnospiraceae bacterium]|nr:radical SAM protein [Lachnospiraceae bacterium]